MDIAGMKQGIANNAATISGLRSLPYIPDSVSPPTFFVGEVDILFDRTFHRGMDEITVSCRLLVSRATDWAGQAQLDAYLIGSGTNSIKAALESDRTLGGKCDDSNVTRISGYHQYEVGSTYYYGAEISVHVIGSG